MIQGGAPSGLRCCPCGSSFRIMKNTWGKGYRIFSTVKENRWGHRGRGVPAWKPQDAIVWGCKRDWIVRDPLMWEVPEPWDVCQEICTQGVEPAQECLAGNKVRRAGPLKICSCPAVLWSSGSSLCLHYFLLEWNIYSVPLYVRNVQICYLIFFSQRVSVKRLTSLRRDFQLLNKVETERLALWYGHGPKGARE